MPGCISKDRLPAIIKQLSHSDLTHRLLLVVVSALLCRCVVSKQNPKRACRACRSTYVKFDPVSSFTRRCVRLCSDSTLSFVSPFRVKHNHRLISCMASCYYKYVRSLRKLEACLAHRTLGKNLVVHDFEAKADYFVREREREPFYYYI